VAPAEQLTVIAGESEARIRLRSAAESTAELERARLDKELTTARDLLQATRTRLANEAFVAKARPDVVAGARAREAELADQVARLEARVSSSTGRPAEGRR